MSQEILFGVKLVTEVLTGFLVRLGTKVARKVTRCDFLLCIRLFLKQIAHAQLKKTVFCSFICKFLAATSNLHARFSFDAVPQK